MSLARSGYDEHDGCAIIIMVQTLRTLFAVGLGEGRLRSQSQNHPDIAMVAMPCAWFYIYTPNDAA